LHNEDSVIGFDTLEHEIGSTENALECVVPIKGGLFETIQGFEEEENMVWEVRVNVPFRLVR
jgi:hypothetical protein